MCESIRPPVRLSVCLCRRACSCIQMFDRTCVCSSMYAFVCLYARVREGICLGPSIRLSVRVHVRASKCLFAHAKKNRKDDRVKKTVQELKTG